MARPRSNKPKPGFMDCYKKFHDGDYGSPEQWKSAFAERMSLEEAEAILGENDPHTILGVHLSSTKAEIQTAYRKLCLKHHPDQGGDPEQFKRVHAAYVKLTSR